MTSNDENMEDEPATSRLFIPFQKRLNVLEETVRQRALEYARQFYLHNRSTAEEALEKGITKAELEIRKL